MNAREKLALANDWIDDEFDAAGEVNRKDGQRLLYIELGEHGDVDADGRRRYYITDDNTAQPIDPTNEAEVRDAARQWIKAVQS